MQIPSLPRVRSTFAALAILTLAACGGGGGGSGSDNPAAPAAGSAGPSLGVITNATVNFFQADGSTLIGSSDTGNSGVVTVPVGAYTGPVVIEVLGDDVDAMYFDEAAGSQIAFPSTASMHALAPSPGTVGVTPLTEIAYQAAVNQSLFPISASAVNELNEIVRAALAPGLTSILSVPTLIDGSNILSDDEAGNYALVLAALAELASSDGTPALTVLNALVADLADGVIDGQDDGTPITVPYANFITEMQAALSTAAGKYGYPMGSDETAQTPASTAVDTSGVMNPDTGGGDGPNGVTQPATVNAALQNQYMLVATANQAGSPFTDDQMVMALVSSDNTLQIDGGTILSNPFNRQISGSFNTNEIIWLDSNTNIEYALSNNATGTFNEINVGDASNPISDGIPGFLGQLVEQNTGGGPDNIELVQALAGTYTVDMVVSGSHTRGTVIIAADGALDYDTGLSFAVSDYDAVFDRRFLDEPAYFIETTNDGSGPRFDLLLDDSDNLIGVRYFPMGFGSSGGSEVSLASDQAEDPEVDNQGMARVSGNGFTGVVNGTEYSYNGNVIDSSGMDDVLRLDGISEGGIARWRLFAPSAEGTYQCDDAGNGPVLQLIQAGADSGVASGDGECTIKLVQAGPIFEGYFTGSFVRNVDQSQVTVTDGYFYYDPTTGGDGGGDLPAGVNAASINFTQGGGSFATDDSYVANLSGNGDSRANQQQFANFADSPDITFFQFNGLPYTTGSFACGSFPPGVGTFLAVSMNLNFTFGSGNATSSCTINITSASGGTFEGNYTATLFNGDGSDSVSIEGDFRFPDPRS